MKEKNATFDEMKVTDVYKIACYELYHTNFIKINDIIHSYDNFKLQKILDIVEDTTERKNNLFDDFYGLSPEEK